MISCGTKKVGMKDQTVRSCEESICLHSAPRILHTNILPGLNSTFAASPRLYISFHFSDVLETEHQPIARWTGGVCIDFLNPRVIGNLCLPISINRTYEQL
jgi:hypothetical protein